MDSLVWMLGTAVDAEAGWIDDFGIVLLAAGVAVVIFHSLRLPVIFGYLLAGILIGPHFLGSGLVDDASAIQQISELGIIFLLFFIGMEFDLRRLQQVFGPALLGIILQTIGMLYVAQFFAPFLGWTAVNTLFFGSLLAISSSMVTVRVLRDSGKLQSTPAQYAVGILILEDVLAVILLAVLTGVALTQTFDWAEASVILFLMGIFVVVVFLVGRTFLPRLLSRLDETASSAETITLASVGLVMGVSILALRMNFSPALGAFIAGTMLSQTQVSHRVEGMNRSLHDVFSAVFFVSIGMQMQLGLLVSNLAWVLLVSGAIIFGKIFTCWLGIWLAGQRGRLAFLAAVPKSQIGEFSFIIAGLGSSLGVMDERSGSIAFGAAFTTILLTPILTRHAEWFADQAERRTPARVQKIMDAYRNVIEGIFRGLGANLILRLIRRPLIQILLYLILIIGIIISGSIFQQVIADRFGQSLSPGIWTAVYWLSIGVVVSPFVFAVLRNVNAMSIVLTESLFASRSSRPIYTARVRQLINHGVFATLLFVLGLGFLTAARDYLPNTAILVFAITGVIIIVILLQRQLIHVNSRFEVLFLESFQEDLRTAAEECRKGLFAEIKEHAPWPVEIGDVVMPARAVQAGKRIRDLDLREQFGVNVLALGRGDKMVFDPVPNAPVFGEDRLVLVGDREGIVAAKAAVLEQETSVPSAELIQWREQFALQEVHLEPGSELSGRTLAGAGVRKKYGVTVVGIQRHSRREMRPEPDAVIRGGDVLLVAGEPGRIQAFAEDCTA